MSNPSNIESLKDAMKFLAARCDGAHSEDGQGFNKMDSHFGKSLASQERWSIKQAQYAYRMLRKYKGQLLEAGINIDSITYPDENAIPARPQPKAEISIEAGEFVISFPFDNRIIQTVRNLPDRRWDSIAKVWRVPLNHVLEVDEFAQANSFEVSDEASALIDQLRRAAEAQREYEEEIIAASKASSTEMEMPIDGLHPFQAAGVEYALTMRKTFIADEMGLGKTVQALTALEADNAFPALIIVPGSVKLNWKAEANHWLPNRSVRVINPSDQIEGKAADITIINYELVGKRAGALMVGKFKAMVLDESHFVKNPKAKRTGTIKKLAKALRGKEPMVLALSGTPLVNRPKELLPQLEIIGQIDNLGGHKEFYREYVQNAQYNQLNIELRKNCMVRRLKKDVLTELPPRTFAMTPIELSNRAEYDFAQRDFMTWLASHNPDAMSTAEKAEALVRLNKLRWLCAKGKLADTGDWCDDFLESDGKLVVFAHHKDIVDALTWRLAKFNPRVIKGGQSMVERDEAVKAFQNDDSVRVIICSLKAAGVGLTLTAASNVAFAELDWTPAGMAQAVDRCHRIGQRDAVTGWQIVSAKTIDEYMLTILQEKKDIMDQILDGKAPAEAEDSILDELLRLMAKDANAVA